MSERRTLAANHAQMITDSAISSEVAEARGYWTATARSQMHSLGFAPSQCLPPALIIPVRNALGEIVTYQARPDSPRVRDGKPLKYETPRGSRMALDVPLDAQAKLGDPSIPLYITEGARKADAAVSKGLCCIALLGVWNWRGTNEHGGKTTLPDWDQIALNGRRVYICFDSDVMTKPAVHSAMSRLKAFLEMRRASKVLLIYLPQDPSGAKTGLDDFLAQGHTVTELMCMATTEVREAPSQEDETGNLPYLATPHGLVRVVRQRDEEVRQQLTNFHAKIVSQVVRNDGVEQQRQMEIVAQLRGKTGSVLVTPSRFTAMDWPMECLGSGAVVYPGMGVRDQARAAIQLLSGDVPEREVFTHTGWAQINGQWVYLHCGSAIGPEGTVDGIEVETDGALSLTRIQIPGSAEELKAAVEALLRFLTIAPAAMVYPLFASIWRAAMMPADYSIHISGETGTGKTQLAALVQQCWGPDFTAGHLPGSWSSTANALEALAFRAKDMILVVDDFLPRGTTAEIAQNHAKADRLLRAQGNHSGRQRQRADGSLRPIKPPRGTILSTGEDIPAGESLRARVLVLEHIRGSLHWDKLSACQADAAKGLYSKALGGFLQWAARDYPAVVNRLKETAAELRGQMLSGTGHKRTPDMVAQLAAGLRLFAAFAEETECLSPGKAAELLETGKEALRIAAAAQSRHQGASDPVVRYLELLRACLASGRAHVANRVGDVPVNPSAWGWRPGDIQGQWRCGGARIGWVVGPDLYLEPAAAFSAVQEMARQTGEPLAISQRTLHKRLNERGLLASTEDCRNTLVVRQALDHSRRRVLHLKAHTVMPVETDQTDRSGSDRPSGEE